MKINLLIYLLLPIYIVGASTKEINPLYTDITSTNSFKPVQNLRVLGGHNAVEGQFPYQVLLRLRGWPFCGGSIISRSYIITAAHCVIKNNISYPAANLTIRAGSIHLNSDGVIVQVAAVKPHPKYRSGIVHNDIAVLQLATPLNFTEFIGTIPLASTAAVLSGSAVITAGWGRTQNSGPMSNILQYTTLRAITNAECRSYLSNLSNSILCLAHRTGNGVCHGDSGGPAVYKGQLVGIANFALGRCGASTPDGYARVAAFDSWIRQNSDV